MINFARESTRGKKRGQRIPSCMKAHAVDHGVSTMHIYMQAPASENTGLQDRSDPGDDGNHEGCKIHFARRPVQASVMLP